MSTPTERADEMAPVPVPGRTYRVAVAEQKPGYAMGGQDVTAVYVRQAIRTMELAGVTPYPVGGEGIIGLGATLYIPVSLFAAAPLRAHPSADHSDGV